MILAFCNRTYEEEREETWDSAEDDKRAGCIPDILRTDDAPRSDQDCFQEGSGTNSTNSDKESDVLNQKIDQLSKKQKVTVDTTEVSPEELAADHAIASNKGPEHAPKRDTGKDVHRQRNKNSDETSELIKDERVINSRINQVLSALHFEVQFMGLASSTMICYCMAHHTIYELIYGLLLELTEMRVQNYNLLYASILMLGLILMRSTGFIWLFLSSKHYRQRKAEAKRRGKDASLEVKFQDWLDVRPRLKTMMEVCGFYLCYISLSFFWNNFLASFADQKESILLQLPSVLQREKALLTNPINQSRAGCSMLEESCNVESNMEAEDYEFIYNNVAKMSYYQYSGNVEAPLITAPTAFFVYILGFSISVYILSQTGVSFVDNW